ncbi:MAG: glycerophosphodiester phosphodiesterase [Actinobacteria bacterium]|nr:glycerophosphodiester phosphodiesterase [Actinomycetota bacterium]
MTRPWRRDAGERPLILAHRGASRAEPENTVAAFRAAARLGADGVELDVRRRADGQAAVLHDAALADGRVLVEVPAAELPGHVPDLDEALEACGDLLVNVEIKNWPTDPDFDPDAALARTVVAAAARRRAHHRWIVSCFHRATVRLVHDLDVRLPTALLTAAPDLVRASEVALADGHVALHPWDPHVDAGAVRAAHDAGLAVNVWTVDDPDRVRRLAAWGVDGIVTNVPDVAVAALSRG